MSFRSPAGPTWMTLIRIAADLARADLPGLCADLADRLRCQAPGGTVVCDVRAVVRPDVVTVEALARLRLTARRHGYALAVVGAGPQLAGLIGLLGLSETFRQAEQREEAVGVEEVVDARDPPV
jgi:anti-anti-sigma regulatory factor